MGILTKEQVNVHLKTIVGTNLIGGWWNSPNRMWGGKTPAELWGEPGGAETISNYVKTRSGTVF